jgi:putative SOS response-associated peptidase YedK
MDQDRDHSGQLRPLGVPTALLMSYPASKMLAYKVSTRVNSPKNTDAEIIEPL